MKISKKISWPLKSFWRVHSVQNDELITMIPSIYLQLAPNSSQLRWTEPVPTTRLLSKTNHLPNQGYPAVVNESQTRKFKVPKSYCITKVISGAHLKTAIMALFTSLVGASGLGEYSSGREDFARARRGPFWRFRTTRAQTWPPQNTNTRPFNLLTTRICRQVPFQQDPAEARRVLPYWLRHLWCCLGWLRLCASQRSPALSRGSGEEAACSERAATGVGGYNDNLCMNWTTVESLVSE